ncbi:MAG: aldo/keto reductase [Planctomycetota bacterium]|jgi:predicted dehydrogenase/aryl-alcohol dehydrogenase-like predicted oxidoreductase|nr:aldo/keto reductase [Planctomycetota bacterium]
MTSITSLRWGIIGPGGIANKFATAMADAAHGELVAIASRDQAKAQAFADTYQVATAYGSYEALLADPAVDAVYIATPHPHHPRWAIAACEAGKHVLCEKPLALNSFQAEAMIAAARENGVFLMEAFMYRCHPQTRRVVELIKQGVIGEVRTIRASFAFRAGDNPDGRLLSAELGGGGILDVGCYPMSFARLIAGAAQGTDIAEPRDLQAQGMVGVTGVDEYTSAVLRFDGDIIAEIATGVRLNRENDAWIYGTEGRIQVTWPWQPTRGGEDSCIRIVAGGKTTEERIGMDRDPYACEIDAVAEFAKAGQCPYMTWDDTLGQLRALDRWRSAIGVTYPAELPVNHVPPRGSLQRRGDAHMPMGTIPGLAKPVSRLIFGCDNQVDFRQGAAVWDDWFERGGNAFDTAVMYGGGKIETNLGDWIEQRGIRDQVAVIVKGCHTPDCYPDKLTEQLQISLERQKSQCADIYLMHRDNLDVPVSEFIDCLNEHVRAGRISVFGGSNWSIERVKEANAYAVSTGQQGFSVLSNNMSLARMVEPVWGGCISASDAESRAFLTDSGMALLPWSSQARGFFLRADPAFTDDGELVRCWYSDDNFQRLERARVLAEEKSVLPIQIALAYVLNQPFPTFPLIGPRHIVETASSMQGLDIELTAAETSWLNLETARVG